MRISFVSAFLFLAIAMNKCINLSCIGGKEKESIQNVRTKGTCQGLHPKLSAYD